MINSRNLSRIPIILLFFLSNTGSALVFQNFPSIHSAINSEPWLQMPLQRRLKVAILDSNFLGVEDQIGKSLPDDTVYYRGPKPASPEAHPTNHGTAMAQIVNKIADNPQIFLFYTAGITNLKAAVDELIRLHVDIVLNAEVWAAIGNRDGQGIINNIVNKATDAGVYWVNAAGNYETLSFSGPVSTGSDDWVSLPDAGRGLKVLCSPVRDQSTCPIDIVLSWNDFNDSEDGGTNKDLDLSLMDDLWAGVGQSALVQTMEHVGGSQREKTNYPREHLTMQIKGGTYYIGVKNRSKNFDSNDRLFIAIDGEGLTVPKHTKNDSIANPADNSTVLTVGASDHPRSSRSFRLRKPDILAISSIRTDEGEFRGSSNSAAITVGGLTLAKSRIDDLTFEEIIERSTMAANGRTSSPPSSPIGQGIPAAVLGLFPTGQMNSGPCYKPVQRESLPPYLNSLIEQQGAILVETSLGPRLVIQNDPLNLIVGFGVYRHQINDMIVILPNGQLAIVPRFIQIIPGSVEVFQLPQGTQICLEQPPNTAINGGPLFRLFTPTERDRDRLSDRGRPEPKASKSVGIVHIKRKLHDTKN